MIALANTKISILGGTSESDWGDVIDSDTPAATGIPACIVEGRQVIATEGDSQARVVRYYTCRLPHGTVLTGSNRIKDEETGIVYVVDNVSTPLNAVIPQDVRLDLRRVT